MPSPGDRIGGYIIDALIGKGAMGEVYRAHQASLDRHVAIKLLSRERMADADAVRLVLGEARTAGRIRHQHIVAIHDIIDDPAHGLAGYVMEFVDGAPSTSIVHANGCMKPAVAVRFGAQIAEALGIAHATGLIHRDIQPANILIAPGHDGPQAKLLDLGLARERLKAAATQLSIHRLAVIGTPGFIAPEQACNPERATPASDVYALACVIVWWLTGHTAHAGETLIDHVVRCATQAPELDEQVIPDELRDLLMTCLSPDPQARPATGSALATQLLDCDLEPAPATTRPRRPVTRRVLRRRRR